MDPILIRNASLVDHGKQIEYVGVIRASDFYTSSDNCATIISIQLSTLHPNWKLFVHPLPNTQMEISIHDDVNFIKHQHQSIIPSYSPFRRVGPANLLELAMLVQKTQIVKVPKEESAMDKWSKESPASLINHELKTEQLGVVLGEYFNTSNETEDRPPTEFFNYHIRCLPKDSFLTYFPTPIEGKPYRYTEYDCTGSLDVRAKYEALMHNRGIVVKQGGFFKPTNPKEEVPMEPKDTRTWYLRDEDVLYAGTVEKEVFTPFSDRCGFHHQKVSIPDLGVTLFYSLAHIKECGLSHLPIISRTRIDVKEGVTSDMIKLFAFSNIELTNEISIKTPIGKILSVTCEFGTSLKTIEKIWNTHFVLEETVGYLEKDPNYKEDDIIYWAMIVRSSGSDKAHVESFAVNVSTGAHCVESYHTGNYMTIEEGTGRYEYK